MKRPWPLRQHPLPGEPAAAVGRFLAGRYQWLLLVTIVILLALTACQQVDDPSITYDPAALSFSGERAMTWQGEFVETFPDRASGQVNNELAAEWIRDQMTGFGYRCAMDEWEVVNRSRIVPMNNVVCLLPGQSDRAILVVAHHDQSPDTVYGADNDGSGIGIMLHLAELFAAEPLLAHDLVFLSSDGEEYGMLGTRRLVSVEDDLDQIIAAVSLDNLGKEFYSGLDMSPIGQFEGYGPLWLQRLAQESARAAGDIWVPQMRATLNQALDQAVPISFMDQGPLVAAGVPAFGFAGLVPAENAEQHWQTYHTPDDTMDIQSAGVLRQSGRATEALIRQLNAMDSFPDERGPYLYNQESDAVLRGPLLWMIFLAFVAIFLVAGWLAVRREPGGLEAAVASALPHFLSLWLPLVGAVLLLYLFVRIGLMDSYAAYPALAKHRDLTSPRWLAVLLWLIGLWELLQLGRHLARVHMAGRPVPSFRQVRGLALMVVAVGALFVTVKNPFSLLLMLPLFFWLLIGGRSGLGRVLDWLLFLAGGLMIYLLAYVFGFQILRIDLAILWYLMMMFSIGMVSFASAAVIAAILAAGLSLVVKLPLGRKRTAEARIARQEQKAGPAAAK